MSKRLRQQAIKEIVSKGFVPSQAALAEELKTLGFDVTQATLSRDIADLALVKSKEGYLRPEDAGGTADHAGRRGERRARHALRPHHDDPGPDRSGGRRVLHHRMRAERKRPRSAALLSAVSAATLLASVGGLAGSGPGAEYAGRRLALSQALPEETAALLFAAAGSDQRRECDPSFLYLTGDFVPGHPTGTK